MLIRRCLRAKAFQYFFENSEEKLIPFPKLKADIQKLLSSVEELYNEGLNFFRFLHHHALRKLDENNQKICFENLASNPILKSICELNLPKPLIRWDIHPSVVSDLCVYLKTIDSTVLLENPQVLIEVLADFLFLTDGTANDLLEEQNPYWGLDFVIVHYLILEEAKKYTTYNHNQYTKINRFANHIPDQDFLSSLLAKAFEQLDYHHQVISETVENWDVNRISKVDYFMIQLAMAEIKAFKNTPLAIIFNEYVELTKWFSQPKGATFVNGVLKKISKNNVFLLTN